MSAPSPAVTAGDLPQLVLHEPALAHNLALMRDYCAAAGVAHAPHAKTHLAPELLDRQAGVWGFTAATPAQVRALTAYGATRILHANLVVDPGFLAWAAAELLRPGAPDYLCYVDSVAAVAFLADGLRAAGATAPLRVLLEIGFPGGRTGARDDATVTAILAALDEAPELDLAGVAGYEGLMPPAGMPDLFARMRRAVEAARPRIPGVPIVTAGGSSWFDRVVAALGPATWADPVEVVLRSGCYLTHDHGIYARTSPFGQERGEPGAPRFAAALELYARVLSVPEPGLAIVGFGRREVPTDDALPVVLDLPDARVEAVNDHHAYLRCAVGAEPAVGQVLRFGLSHPCGAFDRWRRIPLLDAAGAVVGAVHPLL